LFLYVFCTNSTVKDDVFTVLRTRLRQTIMEWTAGQLLQHTLP